MSKKCARYILIFLASMIFLFGCKKDEEAQPIIEYGTVTDIENVVYKTVKIGDQWWMAENLRVSSFNDGTPIDFLAISESDSIWANTVLPMYTSINDSIFGYLYNAFVVRSDKNIAPAGWHVATDEDWKKLESNIGMNDGELNQTGWRGTDEAEKLATKYSVGWPEGGVLYGSNEFGFTAVPGGCRIFDGRTNISSNTAFWWTASEDGNNNLYRYIDAGDRRIFRQFTYPQYGMSIRCVKD
jgi:uncharacterized protein (TIGR02145 family)